MIDKLDLNADFYRISRKKKKMAKDKFLQKVEIFLPSRSASGRGPVLITKKLFYVLSGLKQ